MDALVVFNLLCIWMKISVVGVHWNRKKVYVYGYLTWVEYLNCYGCLSCI
jgi:hypothetical protein